MSNPSVLPYGAGIASLRGGLTFSTNEEGPRAPRVRRTGWPSATLGMACFGAVLTVLGGIWSHRDRPAAEVGQASVTPVSASPVWIDVNRPFQAYDLSGGPYAKLPLIYEARRAGDGLARQDFVTYGTARPGEDFIRLLFHRRDTDQEEATSLFVDAARLAAGSGLAVVRSGLATTLQTRFGRFEVSGVAVSRGQRSADCLAFRHAEAVLRITGLACGSDDRPIDPTSLACALDRIDLVSAGDDVALRDVFVAAERRRSVGCTRTRTGRLEPAAARAPLRGSLSLASE